MDMIGEILKSSVIGPNIGFRFFSGLLFAAIIVWFVVGFRIANEPRFQVAINKFDIGREFKKATIDWTVTAHNAPGATITSVYLYFVNHNSEIWNASSLIPSEETPISLENGKTYVGTLNFGNEVQQNLKDALNDYVGFPITPKLEISLTTASGNSKPIVLDIAILNIIPEYKGYMANPLFYKSYSFKLK